MNAKGQMTKEQGYVLRMPENGKLPPRQGYGTGSQQQQRQRQRQQQGHFAAGAAGAAGAGAGVVGGPGVGRCVWQLQHQKQDHYLHDTQHSMIRPGGGCQSPTLGNLMVVYTLLL